jgi:hypothetical protein
MRKGEVYTGFRWENLKERNYLEGPGIDRRIIFRRIFRKWDVGARTDLMWLGIGTGGGLFGFHKMRGRL